MVAGMFQSMCEKLEARRLDTAFVTVLCGPRDNVSNVFKSEAPAQLFFIQLIMCIRVGQDGIMCN